MQRRETRPSSEPSPGLSLLLSSHSETTSCWEQAWVSFRSVSPGLREWTPVTFTGATPSAVHMPRPLELKLDRVNRHTSEWLFQGRQEKEVIKLAIINVILVIQQSCCKTGPGSCKGLPGILGEGDTSVPRPESESIYGVRIILTPPIFHPLSLLETKAIRGYWDYYPIAHSWLPPSSIPRVLSSLHSTAPWISYLIWTSQYISEHQMSVPTWQIRKLRLGETKEFSPSALISLVEEKALETKFSDPKSNVLSPPLGEIRQVTTNKAQSSTEPESIPGHDLCFSWT